MHITICSWLKYKIILKFDLPPRAAPRPLIAFGFAYGLAGLGAAFLTSTYTNIKNIKY